MATEKRLIDFEKAKKSVMQILAGKVTTVTAVKVAVAMQDASVDTVPLDDMKEFAEDVVYQFGYYGQYNGRLHIGHGGLSTLEWAFDILGWDNPHPVPEFECEIEGCHEHATCGAPTSDGYKRMCGKHYAERRTDNA